MNKTLQACFPVALAFIGILSGSLAAAQTSKVVVLGTVPASQVNSGLGFNLQPTQEWQWQAAAAAGATHARFQCSWSTVEQQTAPPENEPAATRYVQDPNCTTGFAFAKKYGIHPTVVAAFGPPNHPILTVTVPQGAPVGATTFEVEYAQGFGGETIANLKFPYDYICPINSSTNTCSSQFSSRHSYQGTLIASVTPVDGTHAQVTLASALTEALPAGTTPYLVNEILYPSTATESATDPSVVAYGDYVQFLATNMAAAGVTGDVEIWNEPPWANDPWDYRANLYDPGMYTGSAQSSSNYGFAANLMTRTFPSGITATWNGTSGSGEYSLLGPRMLEYSGEVLTEPSTVFGSESFHPYGGQNSNPEEMMFVTSCLQGTAAATSYPADDPFSNGVNCYIPGMSDVANLMIAVDWDMQQKLINPKYGLGHEITETNVMPPQTGMDLQQAKGVMRQFLGFEADGITPVEFFELYGASSPTLSFVEQVGTSSSYTPNADYTALSDFMADIAPISNPPAAAYSAANMPSVESYTGTYALGTANFVGSRTGQKENSVDYLVWQVSACTTGNFCWFNLPNTPAAPVVVNVPTGMKVSTVVDTVTRATIAFTVSNGKLSLDVADDPVEILLDPLSYTGTTPPSASSGMTVTTLALAAPSTSTYGQTVTLTAKLQPYSTKTANTDGSLVTFLAGSTVIGTSPLSSGVATLQTTSLLAGNDSLGASFGGTANFFASSADASISVAHATPNIVIPAISDKVTTSPAFTVGCSVQLGRSLYLLHREWLGTHKFHHERRGHSRRDGSRNGGA